jgi:hypothetical protein
MCNDLADNMLSQDYGFVVSAVSTVRMTQMLMQELNINLFVTASLPRTICQEQ